MDRDVFRQPRREMRADVSWGLGGITNPGAAVVLRWPASLVTQTGAGAVIVDITARRATTPSLSELRQWIDVVAAHGATDIVGLEAFSDTAASDGAGIGVRSPWADYGAILDDYASRLCWALRQGEGMPDVVVLCASPAAVGEDVATLALVDGVMRLGMSVDVLPVERAPTALLLGDTLLVGLAAYRALLVPPSVRLTGALAQLPRKAAEAGVIVVDLRQFAGEAPRVVGAGEQEQRAPIDLQRLLSVVASALRRLITARLGVSPRIPGSLILARRTVDDGQLVFIVNTAPVPQPVAVELSGVLREIEQWDLETGDVAMKPVHAASFRPLLEPGAGLLLYARPGLPEPPVWNSWFGHGPGRRTWLDLGGVWRISRTSPNLAPLGLLHRRWDEPTVSSTDADLALPMVFRVAEQMSLKPIELIVMHNDAALVVTLDHETRVALRPATCLGLPCSVARLVDLSAGLHCVTIRPQDARSRSVCILCGDFGASSDAAGPVIDAPIPEAPLADVRAAGLRWYVGVVQWRKDVPVQSEGAVVVDMSEQVAGFDDCLELYSGGRRVQRRAWPPYEHDVTACVVGGTVPLEYHTVRSVPPVLRGMSDWLNNPREAGS